MNLTPLRSPQAGADIVSTNSYKVSVELLRNLNYFESHPDASPDLANEMLRASVDLARQAIARHQAASPASWTEPLIAATLGPFSISRPFQSAIGTAVDRAQKASASVDEIAAFHKSKSLTLLEAGADILAFETIASLDETRAIAQVMADLPDACPDACR